MEKRICVHGRVFESYLIVLHTYDYVTLPKTPASCLEWMVARVDGAEIMCACTSFFIIKLVARNRYNHSSSGRLTNDE